MRGVRRDGQESIIDASKLVPGDIVLIEAGDYIPADGLPDLGFQSEGGGSLLLLVNPFRLRRTLRLWWPPVRLWETG